MFAAGMAAVYHYGLLYAVQDIMDSLYKVARAALRKMGF
jgi:hypothetical protein